MSATTTIEIPRLRKAEFLALEKVFAAEIADQLPLQSRSKIFLSLETDGLVEQAVRVFPVDRFGPLEVKGWTLTHAGRFAFCMNC